VGRCLQGYKDIYKRERHEKANDGKTPLWFLLYGSFAPYVAMLCIIIILLFAGFAFADPGNDAIEVIPLFGGMLMVIAYVAMCLGCVLAATIRKPKRFKSPLGLGAGFFGLLFFLQGVVSLISTFDLVTFRYYFVPLQSVFLGAEACIVALIVFPLQRRQMTHTLMAALDVARAA
jgi:hypothetical protein